MPQPSAPDPETGAVQARAEVRIGRSVNCMASAHATVGGMASIALLVSSILLSTAVLVWAARRRLD